MSDVTEITDLTAVIEPESTFDAPDAPDVEDDLSGEFTADDLVRILRELDEAGIELVEEGRPEHAKRTVAETVLPWEQYLKFLTEYPGKTVRLFRYTGEDARAKARRRAGEVKKRLAKANPQECWNIDWQFVKDDESWRVYVSYERDYTETEMAEQHTKMLAAQERGRHAAAVRKAEIDAAKAANPPAAVAEVTIPSQ
jgi:hypothetical protein